MHGISTHERCPICLGRGTNSRGSLCVMCRGLGEILKPEQAQADAGRESDRVRVMQARR